MAINTPTNLSGDYILTDNISIGSGSWQSIGNNSTPFTGTFNGNGHTITFSDNTTFTNSANTNDSYGLFGNVGNSADISNVAIMVSGNLTNNNTNIFNKHTGALIG
ncbi:hypothetical protein [Methanolapillus africanus]